MELSILNTKKSFTEELIKMTDEKKMEVYDALRNLIDKYFKNTVTYSHSYSYEKLANVILQKLQANRDKKKELEEEIAELRKSLPEVETEDVAVTRQVVAGTQRVQQQYIVIALLLLVLVWVAYGKFYKKTQII